MTEAKRNYLRTHRPHRFRWIQWGRKRWERTVGKQYPCDWYSWNTSDRWIAIDGLVISIAKYRRRLRDKQNL